MKVFNNINYRPLGTLGRPAGDPERSALAIAGDDADAKAAVIAFLDSIGYDALDVGSLAEGFRFQVGAPAYGTPYQPDEKSAAGVPVPKERLAEAVAAATR